MRRWRVVLLGAAMLCVAPLAAAPAVAHDALSGSDPADAATLIEAPSQIVLTFTAAQAQVGAEVQVTGPDGQLWADGPAVVADQSVTQQLLPGMPNGAYTILWRSVSIDGHPISGELGFTVDAPLIAPPAPTAQVTAVAEPAGPGLDDPASAPLVGSEGTQGSWWWLLALGVAGLAALAIWVARRRGAPDG